MIKKTAIEYLNQGLSVLPANKAKKFPAIGAWSAYQHRLPSESEINSWLTTSNPDAVCIVTGKVSGNLEIIDFDHQAILFDKWLNQVKQQLPELVDSIVIQRTQSGGKHVIYRCQGAVDGNAKLAKQTIDGKHETLIETRGEGGLFLCAPTEGYTLEQGNFSNIPVITEEQRSELIAIATMFNEVRLPIEYESPHGVWENFNGRPGDEFNARGNVGKILKHHGWQFIGADQVNEHWRRPDKKQGGLSATLRISDNTLYVFSSNAYPFEGGKAYSPFAVYAMLECRGDFAEAAKQLSREGYGQPIEIKQDPEVNLDGILSQGKEKVEAEIVKEEEVPIGPVNPGLIPDKYFMEVPGFINDYVKYSLETALYPKKAMGFCGGITMLSWLIGRKVRTPMNIMPNLYILALAGTCSGKDAPRKINKEIMHKLGAENCYGEKIASPEGLEDVLACHHSVLFQADEINGMLASMRVKNSPLALLSDTLLTAYTSSSSYMSRRTKAGQEQAVHIDHPNLVLFGTAPPVHYYESFTESMLTSGLFGRMTIIDMKQARGRINRKVKSMPVPDSIMDVAKYWHNEFLIQQGGNLVWEHPDPVIVPYSNDNVKELLFDFQEETDDIFNATTDEVERATWGRAGEMARKFALLYACSENYRNPQISESAARWAIKVIRHVIQRQLYKISLYYAENDFHKLTQRIKQKITTVGGKITKYELSRNLNIKVKERDEAIAALVEQGIVSVAIDESSTAKKKPVVYTLLN